MKCLFLFFLSVLYLPHPSSKWLNHIYTTQLGRFLKKVDFTPEVRDACQDLVSTAMGMYFELSANLLPTPAKSHYTFNLRDLNKVSQPKHGSNQNILGFGPAHLPSGEILLNVPCGDLLHKMSAGAMQRSCTYFAQQIIPTSLHRVESLTP